VKFGLKLLSTLVACALVPNGCVWAIGASKLEDVRLGKHAVDPELTNTQTLSAIAELRLKRLRLPIDGINPESLKGSYYSLRGTQPHHAVDILSPRNTPIEAADDGTIAKLWQSAAGGTTIYEFDPAGKYVYYYAHLERYADDLQEGMTVRRGQVLGYVGTSGNAPKNCPHLHFSIGRLVDADKKWWVSAPLDPYEVFRSG
jgi:murein DD-endopeptidase MepM/ murein hydrolase activator NlpD